MLFLLFLCRLNCHAEGGGRLPTLRIQNGQLYGRNARSDLLKAKNARKLMVANGTSDDPERGNRAAYAVPILDDERFFNRGIGTDQNTNLLCNDATFEGKSQVLNQKTLDVPSVFG